MLHWHIIKYDPTLTFVLLSERQRAANKQSSGKASTTKVYNVYTCKLLKIIKVLSSEMIKVLSSFKHELPQTDT